MGTMGWPNMGYWIQACSLVSDTNLNQHGKLKTNYPF